MTGLQTEFSFTLPKGYVDKHGTLHGQGTMRLATARDEIEPLRDPRVSGADDPFLTVIVLSRVITELGSVSQVTPNVIEHLFAADLAFLQDFYGIINFGDPADLEVLIRSVAAQRPLIDVEPHVEDDAPAGGDDQVDAYEVDAHELESHEVDEAATVRLDDQPLDASPAASTQPPRSRRAVIEEVKAPAPA